MKSFLNQQLIEKDERVAEWSRDGYEVWENYAWDLRTVEGKSGHV